MKYLATFVLMISTITAVAASETFNLRFKEEPLQDVWELVENFCDRAEAGESAKLKHPKVRVSAELLQVTCVDAYKVLRELDDRAGK